MAEYVLVRGLARRPERISSSVQGNSVLVSNNQTRIIDLDDPVTRKDLQHHSTLGRLTVIGTKNRNDWSGVTAVVANGVQVNFQQQFEPGGEGLSVNVTTGNLTLAGGTVTPTGNTTNLSQTITNVSSLNGLAVGATITGAGIPASTTITGITAPSTITISNPATATAAGVALTVVVAAGATTVVPAQVATVGAAPSTAGQLRVDLVQVHTGSGVVSVVAGTAGFTGVVAPAVAAGNIALAELQVPANALNLGNIKDVTPRP